ncbi:Transcriptional regulator of ribosomal biogenesis protein [Linnemannia zychae]|nr:Transcriptional regulator of ribosomal biogenesis protein [Linnemannia zychae]
MPVPIEIHSPRMLRTQSSHSTPLLQQFSNLATAYERESNVESQLTSPMLGGPGVSLIAPGLGVSYGGGGLDHINHAAELETAFCRDFYCCGLTLMDLHDLLRHYEECHVRFEDDNDHGLSLDDCGGDSEFFDDESWSDSESLSSSSGSLSSPPGSGSGSGSGSGRTLSMSSGSTRQHYNHQYFQQMSTNASLNKHSNISSAGPFFAPLSPSSQNGGGGEGRNYLHHSQLNLSGINSTTQVLEMFPVSLGRIPKRNAGVSLSDIYAEDDGSHDHDENDSSSAFLNNIIRTRSIGNSNGAVTSSNLTGPPAKRQALESIQQQTAIPAGTTSSLQPQTPQQQQQQKQLPPRSSSSLQRQQRPHPLTSGLIFPPDKNLNAEGSLFGPGNNNNNKAANAHHNGFSGGLLPGPSGAYGRGSAALTSPTSIRPNMFLGIPPTPGSSAAVNGLSISTQSPYIAAAVDLMRQRDEVYSIIEDMTKAPPNASSENKPYRCSVTGCDKAYKNPNGLKYHNLHGHCSNGLGDGGNPENKPYVCTFLECGKRYKNLNGLKYHIEHTHPNLIAALRAHQSGLANHPLIVNGPFPNGNAAAMTIAAALAAVEASPMMALAANAILTAQAAAANQASAAAAAAASSANTATGGASDSVSTCSQSNSGGPKFSSDSDSTPKDGSFVPSTTVTSALMPVTIRSLENVSSLVKTGVPHNIIPIASAPQDMRIP